MTRGIIIYLIAAGSSFGSEPLRVLSWNVESDGNDPATISRELVALGRFDIVALQEVRPENIGRYGNAIQRGISEEYRYFASSTGRSDRLMIVFDSRRLKLHQISELFYFNGIRLNDADFRHRSPYVAEFQDLETGTDFLFVTVHLARGDEKLRTEQARGLRVWGRAQTLPVIAAGDFNMDFDFRTERGNEAFVELQNGAVWKWIPPTPLVDTNWADRDGDGKDNYPDSMLDFSFVTGAAKSWPSKATVIVRPGDFPDDKKRSDHRPVTLEISLAP